MTLLWLFYKSNVAPNSNLLEQALMSDTYLSDLQIARRYGVHRTTMWRWVKANPNFPKPVALSSGCTRWKLSEIIAWEKAKEKTK